MWAWQTAPSAAPFPNNSHRNQPRARVVAQLVHVRVVLGHNGDGVALLPDDEASLLLRSVPQVDAVILIQTERCHEAEMGNRGTR